MFPTDSTRLMEMGFDGNLARIALQAMLKLDMLVPMQVQIIGCNKASDGDVEAALAQLCADRCLSWGVDGILGR